MTTATASPRAETPRTSPTVRVPALDRVRGLAVVLMILDHVAAFSLWHFPDGELGGVEPRDIVRHTVTRASLPLFMLVCGYLLAWRGLEAWRLVQIAAVGALVSVGLDVSSVGIGTPEIVLVLAIVLCGWRAIVLWPVGAIVLGVVQVATFPMFARWGWYGYEPGELAALLGCGVLWRRHYSGQMFRAERLPRWVGSIGRAPLAWYVAHMAVLVGLGLYL